VSDLKNVRINCMAEILVHLQSLRNFYTPASPAWILIHAAQGHIQSVHHLESETNFDSETLGAIQREES